LLKDSPEYLYQNGILSRDGGHFQAVFPSEDEQKRFIKRAIEIIELELPGLRYDITPDIYNNIDPIGNQPVRLPRFQICEDTGADVAAKFEQYTPIERKHYVSKKVSLLEKAGMRFVDKKKKTEDIIGLLEEQLPLKELEKAPDLEKLAGQSGYIALIHADGNGIGQRRKKWAGENDPDQESNVDSKKESRNEFFFHSMRVAVRRAVVDALTETYNSFEINTSNCHRPYQLLMLGGDDVLLLCRPEHAFGFAVNLAREIKKYKIPYEKEGEKQTKEISMGIGIAISKRNVPFYLLHSLSEQLSSNAKKKFRSQPEECSVIDWNMATTSWINDINQHRRNYDIFPKDSKKYCSISRPLFVLPRSDDRHCSLQELLECADEVQKGFEKNIISRSQFKEVAHLIQDGKADNAKEIYKDHIKKN